MAVGSRPLVPSRLAPGGAGCSGRHGTTAHGPTHACVGAYVALTKPRIIELLLDHHRADDGARRARAGRRSVWCSSRCVGGTLAAGGANAINMYVDRDIDALMQRTQGRPLVTGVIEPRDALVFAARPRGRRVRRAVGGRQPAVGRARPRGRRVLRRRLHDLAEAHEPPEHRDRRRRRRRAGARRLGRGHRLARLGADRAVRRHVPVDAAALLGARHPLRRRLPGRRRADAAGRGADRRGRPPDDRLHGGAGRRHAGARPGRRPRLDLRGRRGRARRELHRRHGRPRP